MLYGSFAVSSNADVKLLRIEDTLASTAKKPLSCKINKINNPETPTQKRAFAKYNPKVSSKGRRGVVVVADEMTTNRRIIDKTTIMEDAKSARVRIC